MASLALAGSAAAKPTKSITSPGCGQVLDKAGTTYVLQVDIGPCHTDGLIINNRNKGKDKKLLTLDLNGHTIRGNPIVPDGPDEGTDPDGGFGEGAGVRVVGSNWVVVTSSKPGGTVRDFDAGVLFAPSQAGEIFTPTTNSRVEKVNATENEGNVPFGGGSEDEVTDFSDGIVLVNANNNTVSNNNAFANGSGGIRLDDADNNTVSNNTTDNNRGNGIRFLTGNTGNQVTQNTSTNNAFAGASVSFTSPGNTFKDNVLSSNRSFGASTSFESEGTVFEGNTIANNRSGGITLGSGENTLSGNAITDNGRGATGTGRGNGIFIGSGTDNFPRTGTTVSNNEVHGSGGNGIRIGCLLDQDPENFAIYGCMPYDLNNQVLNNDATGNAVNGPSGTKSISGGQVVGWYDLLDSTNSDATLTPFDPSSAPSVDDPDVPYSGPGLTDCDNNTWSGNTFNTAYPACTTG